LLNAVELELFQLRLALGLEVQLAGNSALDQIQRSSLQLVGSYHGIHGTHFQGISRLIFLATTDPLDGIVITDHARQTYGTAKAWVDAQLNFRQTYLGALSRYAIVGSQAHFKTATQGDAIDGDHSRNRQVFEIVEDLVGFEVAGHQLFVRQLEVIDELGDVGADDEHVLATADDHALDRGVGLDGVDCCTQLIQGKAVEFVDGLTLEVEIQFDDAALKSLSRDGFTFVNHQLISTVWKLNSYTSDASLQQASPDIAA